MPNWCRNTISITGPEDDIKALFKKIKKTETFLEYICQIAEGEHPLDVWGTKWEVDANGFELEEDDLIVGEFLSAWSPPLDAFQHFIESNPEMSIELNYCEEGMAFVGHYIVDEGRVIVDQDYDFSYNDYSNVPEELVEYWDIESLAEMFLGEEDA